MRLQDKPEEVGLRQRLSLLLSGETLQAGAPAHELSCNSCHTAHAFNMWDAAVDACQSCHADEHSLAYERSRHFKAYRLERDGKAPVGTGVSCATCHLPRSKDGDAARTKVEHNQNDNLRPSDKMLRSVCTNCHGLAYSMDALADKALVKSNFIGNPSKEAHVKSTDWVKQRLAKKSKKGE